MSWVFRRYALAAGAAALLSTQAVYAAPLRTGPAVDPLVSLSLLGTAQSRAAVCATGNACALPTTLGAAMATTSAAQVQDDDDLPPPPPPPGKAKEFGMLPAVIGLLVLLGLIVAIVSGGDDATGDLTPVSPA